MSRFRPTLWVAVILLLGGCSRAGDELRAVAGGGRSGRIVFTDTDAGGVVQVYSIRPDGSGRQQLTTAGGEFPAWSHDRLRIVYAADAQLWVMDADGRHKTQLTFAPDAADFVPSFSPDSSQIVFSSLRTGHPEVWLMDADGSNLRRLTTTTVNSMTHNGDGILWSIHGSFSPDGTRIVYASTQSGRSQTWAMDADGANPIQLTTDGNADFPDANAPSWSPDGSRIAFWSGFETESGYVWVMNSDGTSRRQVTSGKTPSGDPLQSDNPAWSPDGRILFESMRPPVFQMQTWITAADGSGEPQVLLTTAYGGGRLPW